MKIQVKLEHFLIGVAATVAAFCIIAVGAPYLLAGQNNTTLVFADTALTASRNGRVAGVSAATILSQPTLSWDGYTWSPVYVTYGSDSQNGNGQWYVDGSTLKQDQVSALHYKIIATSMTPGSDYEVTANVALRSGNQFGVCARLDTAGNGYCFALGDNSDVFFAHFRNGDQNPTVGKVASTSGRSLNTVYTLKFRVLGNRLYGKYYPAGSPEPSSWMIDTIDTEFTSGQVGFFTYGSQPTIESVSVSSVTLPPTPPPTVADLTPTPITYTQSASVVKTGDSVAFFSGIKNQGGIDSGIYNIKWLVDGQLVAEHGLFSLAANKTYRSTADANLQILWTATPGTHTIQFVVDSSNMVTESYEDNNSVSITVTVAAPTSAVVACDNAGQIGNNQFIGCVWKWRDNSVLPTAPDDGTSAGNAPAGPVVLSGPVPQTATVLSFDWPYPSEPPINAFSGKDYYTARWRSNFTFDPGTYRFTGGADDGIRVRVNGATKIDQWYRGSYHDGSFDMTFNSRQNAQIDVDYFEHIWTGTVKFGWTATSPVAPLSIRLTSTPPAEDRKSTRLNSSHSSISCAVF